MYAGSMSTRLSHQPGFARLYYNDETRRGNVTDARTRPAGRAVRGQPDPPEGACLPHARLAKRGRRRRPGGLAPARPLRRRAVENPGGWLTTVVGRVCLDMLRKSRRGDT